MGIKSTYTWYKTEDTKAVWFDTVTLKGKLCCYQLCHALMLNNLELFSEISSNLACIIIYVFLA